VKGLLLRRQTSLALSDEVKAMAWKAQHRLNKRYKTLTAKGENTNQIVTAIARELLGFAWAIATHNSGRLLRPATVSRMYSFRTTASKAARTPEKQNPRQFLCGTSSGSNPGV
jgi:hypothetical protein